ncbi:uncharacterized protein PITG_04855 [Phytophthora infestans T30-4]|uniref:Uncharacterized protein n=1 Tax=Phytophthora infestans (strain T30-4) TaxID=403677 RepID=D0N270_PHYIT|nr:uncharacterized protein PITG_04855 [Phytophthora infestans T30-4]EEY68399.1 hypothetical protein PITG_04855 [Phytophthora infestans T30-4]|eukprot:XP_002905558.1 hypothetical protein PITG_04855 [Phytophthora infestans T30-4]
MSSRGEVERASVECLQHGVLLPTTVVSKPEESDARPEVETSAADIPAAPFKPFEECGVCQEKNVERQSERNGTVLSQKTT